MHTAMKFITSAGLFGGLMIAPVSGHAAAPPPTLRPVTVVNTATQPVPVRDLDNAAKQVFQYTLSPSSGTSNFAQDSFVVPAGKRLVLEYYSAQLTQYPVGGYGYVYLIITAGGNQAYYKIIPPVASTVPVNQLTRLYADPGTSVIAQVAQSSGSSSGASVIVSGYLVNLP